MSEVAPRTILRYEQIDSEKVTPPLGEGEVLSTGYVIVAHLNRSRVLDVYDVWSEERTCRCIAKVLRPDRIEDRKARSRLLQEGRILERLTHPHIVRAYETLEKPRPVVVLETLGGNTLEYLIAVNGRRPLHLSDVAFLGLHLCSAMHYLHRQGLLHLDLKPSNIVSNLGLTKVLDFSIARPPGRVRAGLGTRQYMAPEQACGGLLSEATDVWGIGAVLFEAATGLSPFKPEAGQEYEQLERRADPVGVHRHVPAPFATAVNRCLDPEPSRRPAVDELAELLNELVYEQS
jgi:serine/threonine protein kinase